MKLTFNKGTLEALYHQFNRRSYVHPDPLEFLYAYEDIRDREVAGLVASSLAYGKVAQILASVSIVLSVMGPSPFLFLRESSVESIRHAVKNFRHRFATGEQLSGMLIGIKRMIGKYDSIYECLLCGYQKNHHTVLPALGAFAGTLKALSPADPGHLVALPERGSACKRLNLYLRWMIRKDSVDPGGWDDIPASKLVIPLDTHMHRIGLSFGLTCRKQADIRTVLEITSGYQNLAPEDPVRYDFALTRLGIRGHIDREIK